MPTISDVFELPKPEDLHALGFVIKLREAAPSSAEVEKLVRDYVVTPSVERELPRLLDSMRQVFDRGEELGRFVHGSFGSGKSHFMTMLALLLENVPAAWDKLRPALLSHRTQQAAAGREVPDHELWLPGANLLVVRLHMLSVRGRTTGLDRAVYDAFNSALTRRGKAPFEFLHVDGIFEQARREAESYGDIVWKKLAAAGVVSGREDFEALAQGSARAREGFARAWLQYKGVDAGQAGVDPRWSEGLRRLTAHAREQGFGGVVLMIDELLLWLAEKAREEFAREINDLNLIVDHTTGQRPAPVFVFAAVQRDLKEFFPDLVDESQVHEHLDHHSERFKPYIKLQDVELRHIAKGRVLRQKDPAAVALAVADLASRHQKILPALLAGADPAYLADVYPFHPALIEMLVDVTALMQRERSALRLLYELLVIHHPDLPLGEFLPVGSAFPALFPPSGVEASKKIELMQDIHHQYYARLQPAMTELGQDASLAMDTERRRALDQLVRTVLLAEVSPRLKQGGLSMERLVQLNSVDVEGESFRGRVSVAHGDLFALSQKVPDLQLVGSGKTAIVRYVLGRVSMTEILGRARSKVGTVHKRFEVFWPALKVALGLRDERGNDAVRWVVTGSGHEAEWSLLWRRTRRPGMLRLCNVRDISYDAFDPPPGGFTLLIDYPWDDAGHTVDEDRLKTVTVRNSRGARFTAAWLPRHLTPGELDVLTDLAAVRYLQTQAGQQELLETLSAPDRAKVLEQAHQREGSLMARLVEVLREVYVQQGEFAALISDVEKRPPRETEAENLEHIATMLMDRRFPGHPQFGAEPRKADLELLLRWMVDAGDLHASVAYDEATGKVLRTLGQPLELANLGQVKASLRLDSRYIKDVLQRTDQDSVAWAPIAEHLRDTWGLQPLVIDLFLCFLCQRDHRALREPDGQPCEVSIGMSPSLSIRLQRGRLVEQVDWHRLRDLAHQLLDLTRPAANRSLQAQDRLAQQLRERAQARRTTLHGLEQRVVHLGVSGGDRLTELAEARARLAPAVQATTDSYKVLVELLAQWPEQPGDPLLSLVQHAELIREALGELDERARANLQSGVHHPIHGEEVQGHLAALHGRLTAAQAEQPVTKAWVLQWNSRAHALVKKLIELAPPPPPPPPPPPVPTPPPVPVKHLCEATLDPTDPDAVSDFLVEVRRALSDLGEARVSVVLLRREDRP